MTQKNKDDVRYEIAELQRDKIIYAVEACAVTLVASFIYVAAGQFAKGQSAEIIRFASVGIALIYTLYALIGNFIRLVMIKKRRLYLELL